MLLTLTTTHRPATDLGYLLHKHPDRLQHFTLPFGQAHIFYPEAQEARCTMALVLEIDAFAHRDSHPAWEGFALGQYVNDRPYVASSFLSVTLSQVLGSALNGRCRAKPLLVDLPIPLRAKISVITCRDGPELLTQLFQPLGYELNLLQHPLEPRFPEWGESPYYTLELSQTTHLSTLLKHLYVLLPVLDNDKHYFTGSEEVEKLLHRGEDWLATHPARDLIIRRYLRHRSSLVQQALNRLAEAASDRPEAEDRSHTQEEELETPLHLNRQRLERVAAVIAQSGVRSVADLGCGEGKLLELLWQQPQLEHLTGLDVSARELEKAARRLQNLPFSKQQPQRLQLLHGSVLYRDPRLKKAEALVAIEVLEHLDLSRLEAFAQFLFKDHRPRLVILTSPNAEYNACFSALPAGQFRHSDHRFEWSRAEFEAWCLEIARQRHYHLRFEGIGPRDETYGCPTQMAIFSLNP